MTIANGILIGTIVLPGTERVIRDSTAVWEEPSSDIYPRPRGGKVDKLTFHWTAGNPHTGPRAGFKLVDAMKKRRKDSDGDGKITAADAMMDVSIHFGIAWDGGIFQTCNLESATIHTTRAVNLKSVGVELMWPGTIEQAKKLGMPDKAPVIGSARGRNIKCYPPSEEMMASAIWLARTLTSAQHPMLAIPLARGDEGKAGILEHRDIKSSTKVDAAGLVVGALGL